MRTFQPTPPEIADLVPDDAPGPREIGFEMPRAYNASRVLFDNLQRGHAGHTAVHAPQGAFTYTDLCAGAAQFGHGFVSLGLKRGERVLMLLEETPYAVAAFYGAIRAGLVPVLLDPAASTAQIQLIANEAHALAAVVGARSLPQMTADAVADTPLSAFILLEGEPHGREPLPTVPVFPWLADFPSELTAAETDRDEMAFWLIAPGRAGKPKAVVHLQHSLAYAAACHVRAVLGLSAGDRLMSLSPLFTSAGVCASLAFAFSAGASCIMGVDVNAGDAGMMELQRLEPTVLVAPPQRFVDLLARGDGNRRALRDVRACLSTGPVSNPKIHQAWQQRFSQRIIEGLGMPETLCSFISATPDVHKPGAIGRRVPGFELILTDETGRPVADGQEGVLWVRGHSSAPCYWNRPAETAETMGAEGWIFTGERLTRDGYGFFTQSPQSGGAEPGADA